jgi:hypothetical protein
MVYLVIPRPRLTQHLSQGLTRDLILFSALPEPLVCLNGKLSECRQVAILRQ